jgi:16S rRNA processing protein RimM
METLAFAEILSSYGIKGELKVKSLSGETGHFYKIKKVVIPRNGKEERFDLEGIRETDTLLLVKLRGIENPEDAKTLAGLEMRADRAFSCPVREGEFYCADLIDSEVRNETEKVGTVRSVIEIGGRSMLEIEKREGTVAMIPFMKKFISKVDVVSHTIVLSGEADIF